MAPLSRVFYFRSALLLAVALGSGCASRGAYFEMPNGQAPIARLARRQLADLVRLAKRESLTWSSAARSLHNLPWLSANVEHADRLAKLEHASHDDAAFAAHAPALLTEMLDAGWGALSGALAGLEDAAELTALARPAFDAMAKRETEMLKGLQSERDRRAWTRRLIFALPDDVASAVPGVRSSAPLSVSPIIVGWMGQPIALREEEPLRIASTPATWGA
jgi:hypothetical protein